MACFLALAVAGALAGTPATPGWLGLGFTVQRGSEKDAPSWIYVQRLAPGGPAARAGLHVQDLITAIDGKPIRFADTADALAYFASLAPGKVLTFSVVRQHRNLSVRVRATEVPEEYRERWSQSRGRARQRLPPP
jgi:S1-C subfamily serine protease